MEKETYFSQALKDGLDEFEKKFVRKSAFGVSIGAIDNFNERAENQVKSFLTSFAQKIKEGTEKDVGENLDKIIKEGVNKDNQLTK